MNIDIWDNFSIDTVIPSPVDPSIFNKTNCLGWKNELTVYSLEAIVILIIVTTLFCLFAFAGNVTVIIAIVRDRVISKHKQHLYLLSLAVADALLVVLVVPFTLTNELLGYWPFGDTYCRIYLSLDILFCTASICNICCIGIDRFVSVKYPTKYVMLRRLPRIRAAILFIWIYAIAVSLIPFTTETKIIRGTKHECFINDSSWFIILSSSLSFFLPACIIGPIYFNIFLIGKRLARAQKARSLKTAIWNGKDVSNKTRQLLAKSSNTVDPKESAKEKMSRENLADFCSSCSTLRPSTDASSSIHPVNVQFNAKTGKVTANAVDEKKSGKGTRNDGNSAGWRYGNFLDVPKKKRCRTCTVSSTNTETKPRNSVEEEATADEIVFLKNNSILHEKESNQNGNSSPQYPIYSRKTHHSSSTNYKHYQTRSGFYKFLRTSCGKFSFSKDGDSGTETRLVLAPCKEKMANHNSSLSPNVFSFTKGKNSALKRRASTISALQILGASRREKRFIFIIFVVTGFFLLCWTPFFTTYFVYAICRKCCIDQNMFKTFFWIGYLNSGVNPLLYTVFNKDFRNAFKRLFLSLRQRCR